MNVARSCWSDPPETEEIPELHRIQWNADQQRRPCWPQQDRVLVNPTFRHEFSNVERCRVRLAEDLAEKQRVKASRRFEYNGDRKAHPPEAPENLNRTPG